MCVVTPLVTSVSGGAVCLMPDYRAPDGYTPKVVGGNDYVSHTSPELKGGGGDGTFDGMEPRIAKLEASMEYVQRDISLLQTDVRAIQSDLGGAGGIRDRVARIEERIAHLPSKGFIVTTTLATLAIVAAVVVFQSHIQRFVGAPTTATTLPQVR